jgi:hypothetical protein
VQRARSSPLVAKPLLIHKSQSQFQLEHMAASRLEVASVRHVFIHYPLVWLIMKFNPASKFMIDTGAGVIDADYRGVVFVLLFNLSDKDFQGTWHCLLIN